MQATELLQPEKIPRRSPKGDHHNALGINIVSASRSQNIRKWTASPSSGSSMSLCHTGESISGEKLFLQGVRIKLFNISISTTDLTI